MNTLGSDQPGGRQTEWIVRLTRGFERWVIVLLIGMMIVVVAISVVELALAIVRSLIDAPMLLGADELLEIFGLFLLVLIGIELLETIRAPLKSNVIHVEIVLEVALIAVARKVIVVPMDKYSPAMLLAIAALIVAVAVGYHLQRRARTKDDEQSSDDRQSSAG